MGVTGIREDPAHYAYQTFIIKPAIVGNLTFVKAQTQSLYGLIIVDWQKKGALLRMNITVPVNSKATVYVPATDVKDVTEGGVAVSQADGVTFLRMRGKAAVFQVQSGMYQFTSK